MYEKYPISGIKQTYRRQTEIRTIAMPLLIGTLLIALTVFFFKSGPADPDEQEPIASRAEESVIPESGNTSGEISQPADSNEEAEAELQAVPIAPVPVSTVPGEADGTVTVALSENTFPSFTEWMSPSELDNYIRTQNKGHVQSFWKRGHWITAVEGRWQSNTHQFRISYEKMPAPDSWEWQYRVDQSREDFVENIQSFAAKGFNLVQSNSYQRPDGSQRFQAVWRRDTSTQTIADTSGATEANPIDIQ